jgi:FSR family fosmidomycin resistance protein-like MFS transporter
MQVRKYDAMTSADSTIATGGPGTARGRGLALAACCGTHALQDGLTSTVNVLLPILAQAFGLSYAQVGIVKASNLSAMGLLEIPAGLLSERLGTRLLLVFGLLTVGIGYLWLALAAGFGAMLFSLALAGVGAAFQHTLASAIIAAAFPGAGRRPALGTYNAAGDIGKLLMSGLFTLLVGFGVGWRGISLGYSAAAITLALLVLVLLLRARIGGRPPRGAGTDGAVPAALGWGIRNRAAFAGLCAVNFLDSTVQSGFGTFIAFLMIERGVEVGLAGLAVVLTLAGGVVGKFCCGFLARRMGVVPSLALVQTLTVVGIVAVTFAPVGTAYLLLPVLGVFLQGSSSISYGTVTDLFTAERQARGFSLIYTTSNLSSVAATLVLGVISDAFGLEVTMLTMAGLTAATLPVCGLLRRGLSGTAH